MDMPRINLPRIIVFDSIYEEDEGIDALREQCSLMATFGYKTKIITYGTGSTLMSYVTDVTDDELKSAFMKHTGEDDEEAEDELMRSWDPSDCAVGSKITTI